MATMEDQLISRIVRDGLPAYKRALEWGVTHQDIKTTVASAVWRDFDARYRSSESKGSLLGPTSITIRFPNFQLIDDLSMSLDDLCKEVRKDRLTSEMKQLLLDATRDADFDPVATLTRLRSQLDPLVELGTTKKTDVDFEASFNDILDDYESMERGDYKAVANWLWPSFQNCTGGIAEDDFIVFYGRPKSMKTWVVCALIAYLYESGKKILLYTKEMTPRNIFKRISGCLAKIPYQELRTGGLNPRERASLLDIKNLIQFNRDTKAGQMVALSAKDVAVGGDTVGWLRSKVEKYKPDVVVIDGMYLMSDGKGGKSADWARVTSISREVSQMRLDLGTPVIATMQANRKAAGHANAELDELAYADAVGQDATIAIRVINEKSKPTIALVVGGSREFYLHGVRIGGVPATDFTEKETMTEKDIVRAKEDDSKKEEEPDDPALHAKPRRVPKTSNGSTEALLAKQLETV